MKSKNNSNYGVKKKNSGLGDIFTPGLELNLGIKMTPPKGVIRNCEKFSCRMERYFLVPRNRLETNPFYSRVLKKLDPSRDGRMVRHFPVGSIFRSVKGHCQSDCVVCW